MSAAVPQRWLQPGATILRPVEDQKTRYVQGTLTRRVSAGASAAEEVWEVKQDDGQGTLSTHEASELKLPVTHGGILGSGARITQGLRVFALRGEWRRGVMSGGPSRDRGRFVKLSRAASDGVGGEPLEVWVSGGQLVSDNPVEPALVTPGGRLLAATDGGGATGGGGGTALPLPRPPIEEIEVTSVDLGAGEVVCRRGAEPGEVVCRLAQLRTRLDSSFRVLVPSGGFQRATVLAAQSHLHPEPRSPRASPPRISPEHLPRISPRAPWRAPPSPPEQPPVQLAHDARPVCRSRR